MNLLIAFFGAVVVLCGVGALISMGLAAWQFCNPKPIPVRRRLSPILGPDGKPLIVCEERKWPSI